MIAGKRFYFGGNRFGVLEEMMKHGCDIGNIITTKGTYLEQELLKRNIPYTCVATKQEMVALLRNETFDYFISNGVHFILPVSELTAGTNKKFINIHPSYLPDLRGKDPIRGAMLFARNGGATCHYMNDMVDEGDIIAQVNIPYTDDLDAGLLYRLSFDAERTAFALAMERNFEPEKKQVISGDYIYYKVNEQDKIIDFTRTAAEISRQVRAFNTPPNYAYFLLAGNQYTVYYAELLTNPYLIKKSNSNALNDVIYAYDRNIIIRKDDCCLKLTMTEPIVAELITLLTGGNMQTLCTMQE